MSSLLPVVMQDLVSIVNNIYISRLCGGAAATLAIYDWFLVFGEEFDTIYRSKWSLPKALFFFIRIITPIGLIIGTIQPLEFGDALSKKAWIHSSIRRPLTNAYRCSGSVLFLTFAMVTSVFAADALFTLRLIALYKSNRLMVWIISVFFTATVFATYALAIASTIAISKFSVIYSELLHVCVSLGTTPLLPPIWYAPGAFEVFLFGLTVYRAWHDAKLISHLSSAPFLVVFYRDGMIAFVVMAAMRGWNIWIYLTQPLSSIYVGTMLFWATNTVLTTRVYTNLVCVIRRPVLTTGVSTGLGFTGIIGGNTASDTHPTTGVVGLTDDHSRWYSSSDEWSRRLSSQTTPRHGTRPKYPPAPVFRYSVMEMPERPTRTLSMSIKDLVEKKPVLDDGGGSRGITSVDLPMDTWRRRASWGSESALEGSGVHMVDLRKPAVGDASKGKGADTDW